MHRTLIKFNDYPQGPMEITEFINLEEARHEIYRLIADLYLPPENDQLIKLELLEKFLSLVSPEAAGYLPPMQDETDLRPLKIDHARLFVGPFKLLAPPYGSIYLENKRELMGASTIDVRNLYKQAGLELSKSIMDAPDHVATELEFMHFLIFKELEAIAQGDLKEALTFMLKQSNFLDKHLGIWFPKFTDLVEEHAATDYFKSLAQISRVFIQQDRSGLSGTKLNDLAELAQQLQ